MKNNPSAADLDFLLANWEANYKKGLLSFWILLQLHQRPCYPLVMREQLEQLSQGSISAEENSLYRALRRFEEVGIVSSRLEPTGQGPDRRYYQLTSSGLDLLRRFIQRNIVIFRAAGVSEKIQAVLESE